MSERITCICRLCGRVVDFDGDVASDPLDGKPMHTMCRDDLLEEREPNPLAPNCPTKEAAKKIKKELARRPGR